MAGKMKKTGVMARRRAVPYSKAGRLAVLEYEDIKEKLEQRYGSGQQGTAVSALHEYAQAQGMGQPKYVVVGRTGPDHMPRFTTEVFIDGKPLAKCRGGTKKAAKEGSSYIALKKLKNKDIKSPKSEAVEETEQEGSVGKVRQPVERRTRASTVRQRVQLYAKTRGLAVTDYDSIKVELHRHFGSGQHGTAVSALHEYAQARGMGSPEYVEVSKTGPDHRPSFTMEVRLDGKPLARCRGNSKKRCKKGASYLARKKLLDMKINELETQLAVEREHGNRMSLLTHVAYLRLVQRNHKALCGNTVLAGIILTSPKHPSGIVVSLAAGNKTIKPEHLSQEGDRVHDCHAEVLARRAFLRYIYRAVGNVTQDKSSFMMIFEKRDPLQPQTTLRLKSGYKLHLYISTAPCGDAAVYTRATVEPSSEPVYSDYDHGILRAKISAGEAAVPVKEEQQFYDRVKAGEDRLYIMSCSDKICKWNVLGIQGALLCHQIEPIYLSSITIGTIYHQGHVARALFDRVQRKNVKPSPQPLGGTAVQNLIRRLRKTREKNKLSEEAPCKEEAVSAHEPELHHSDIEVTLKETQKARNVGVCWNLYDDCVEVLDAQTGQCEPCMDHTIAAVSKRSLYALWRLSELERSVPQSDQQTYQEAKMAATEYQRLKKRLYQQLKTNGHGTWLSLPQEVDVFGYHDEPQKPSSSSSDDDSSSFSDGSSDSESSSSDSSSDD